MPLWSFNFCVYKVWLVQYVRRFKSNQVQTFHAQVIFSMNIVSVSCGSRGISLSTGRDAGRGKAAYIWISLDPAKAGPTLRGGIVVV